MGTVTTPVPGTARLSLLRDLLTLARPHQWAKNLLVVPLPLLDSSTWRLSTLWWLAWAVVSFTCASALVYVGNDIADRHRDRLHPTKRLRPVAAGRVPVPIAVGFAATLAVALAGLLAFGPPLLAVPIVAYLALNLAYSLRLKHLPLLDLFVIAVGFQLRAVAGYLAVDGPVSHWLLVSVLAVCLMMILGKRRRELDLRDRAHRPALRGYSTALLEQLGVLCAVLAVVAFLLSVHGDLHLGSLQDLALIVSAPPVLFGLFRYLQIVLVNGGGEEPVRVLLRDRALVYTFAGYGTVMAGVLVLARYPGSLAGLG